MILPGKRFVLSATTICILISIFFFSCKQDSNVTSQKSNNPGFLLEKVSSDYSGIDFNNKIIENSRLNYFIWNFIYQGAGVAIGDINNDGLADIYFSGNMEPDRLYLNLGDFQFEDISKKAGIQDRLWSTGVTMADVNADGLLDIYVCKNFFLLQKGVRQNKLYINNGNLTFTEKSSEYGLDDDGYSIQANFFDADNDGDLDMYLVNQPMDQYSAALANPESLVNLPSSDKLYINTKSKYVDQTSKLSLTNKAYGLNAIIADYNNDGWSDIYVSNDYNKGDQLLINKGQLNFTNEIKERLDHSSFYSMGADAADINNDGWIDFISLDMAYSDHYRAKTNMESMRPELFWKLVDEGEHFQYPVNNLHINNGQGYFSEIGQYAGIANSDWSWAALFEDLNNDGLKDLMISNGVLKDLRNNDFLNSIKGKLNPTNFKEINATIPSTPIANEAYLNKGSLIFNSINHSIGFDEKGFSSGMALADLDNDGDMDVVINNSNQIASVFKNNSKNQNNWIDIKLQGKYFNKFGIGAQVTIYYRDQIQTSMMATSRGYMSSCPPIAHFGLGSNESVDSIIVKWDHAQTSKFLNPAINRVIVIDYESTKHSHSNEILKSQIVRKENLIEYKHKENDFDDFKTQVLLPHKLSQNGPFIAKADVNGDQLEDIYIGGAKYQPGTLYLQSTQQEFVIKFNSVFELDKNYEDLEVSFFDIDSDGDKDLYVVSGGNEYSENAEENKDRIYLNDGQGNFSKYNIDLNNTQIDGQTIIVSDFDADGDEDIFLGGRLLPGKYPHPASSRLLMNENGKLILSEVADDFKDIGLITDAIAEDIDKDGDTDIITIGEWGPISIFQNNKGSFSKKEINIFGHESHGWWWSIEKGDFDNDGDTDFLVGNLGLNNKFHPSATKPLQVFSADFDDNGDNDVVLAKIIDKQLYPVRGKECSTEEMPFISDKFNSYDAFAKASLPDILSQVKMDQSLHLSIKSFSSIYLENLGNLEFKASKLPYQCQLGPIKDFIVMDYNNDGFNDFIFGGNHYPTEVETVRYDSNKGGLCLGNGEGQFKFQSSLKTGIYLDGDIRDLELISVGEKTFLLATCNDDSLISIQLKTDLNR